MMQLISVDGVSINVPPSTSLGTDGRSSAARVSRSSPVRLPDQRAHFGAGLRQRIRHDAEFAGRSCGSPIATPTATSSRRRPAPPALSRRSASPPARPAMPGRRSISPRSTSTRPARAGSPHSPSTSTAMRSRANLPSGIFTARVPYAKAAPLPPGCTALAAGHHRRIFFGLVDPTNDPRAHSGSATRRSTATASWSPARSSP